MKEISRRMFIKTGAAGTAALALSSSPAFAIGNKKEKTDVWVFDGEDKRALMEACMKTISENGGFGPKAKKIALKVNAAWDRTPEEAANTNPELVDVFLEKTLASGASVVMPEFGCHRADKSFNNSGLQAVADKHNVSMIDLKEAAKKKGGLFSFGKKSPAFTAIDIPLGKKLKKENVATELLTADAVVNMPKAKHHGGGTLTICMKNWMGSAKGRKMWHAKGLHQCIADFSTFMKPTWAIVDATACMTSKGPQGPSPDMIYPNQVILSKDQVAADSVTTLLFHDSPYKVKYLEIARDMGIGETELSKMNIHRVTV